MAYYPTQPWPQEPLHGSPAVSHSHSPAISRRRAAPTSQWQASQANVPGPYMPHAEPYNPAHDRAAGGNYQYGGNISTPSGTFLDNRAFAPSTPPQVPAREPRPHRLQEYTPTSPPPRYQPAQTVLSPPASYGAPPQGLGDQSIPRRVPPSSYYRPPQTALQRSDRPTISLPIPATEHRTFPTAYPDLQANRGDATNYGFSNGQYLGSPHMPGSSTHQGPPQVPDVFLLPNNYNMSVPVGSIHTAPGWGTQGNQFPNHMNAIGGPSAHSQHQPAPTRVSQQNPPDLLCDGSKKAVIIGINYVGSYFPDVPKLKGCIQDAIAIADFIHKYYHFRKEDILILVDDPEALGGSGWTCWAAPTRANIILAMNWLIDNAQKNGSLFFYFSGHGSQVEDQNGDESDGWDECIWTMNDVPGGSNGEIIDDQIHKIMVKGRSLPRGCRLTALFDSCHSGTVLDLPYVYTHTSRGRHEQRNNMRRYIQKWQAFKSVNAVCLSACTDEGRAVERQGGGALREAFIQVMSPTRGGSKTYYEVLLEIQKNMPRDPQSGRFLQWPQLSSSLQMNLNKEFLI